MNNTVVSALDPQVRNLLHYIVTELPRTEPDWFLDRQTVSGHIYSEAIHLLHAEANSWQPEEDSNDD